LKSSSPIQRFLSKLLNNFSRAVINMAMVFIVPKALGPAHYGDFSFLRDSLQEITGILDLNIGSAHFNYSSKYKETKNATTLYFYFCLTLGIILLSGLTAVNWAGFSGYFWPGQEVGYIYEGAILAYLMYLSVNLTGLSDSKEATVGLEIRRIIVTTIGFILLLALFFNGALTLFSFFGQQIFVYLLFVIVSGIYLRGNNIFGFRFTRVSLSDSKEVIRYFIAFCHPLLILSIFGFIFVYFDRWFLQIVSGSVTQGYYSLAMRLSSVCILFTGAMVPIFRQMVAKAHGENNKSYIQSLFKKSRAFYFVSAFISIFFLFHSREIIYLIGGDQYFGAKVPLMIMLCYPIHQTYGQLCGSMLMSLERTDLVRNIGLFSLALGFIFSYFLIAPNSFFIPGLGLGAIGLSLKMITTQIIIVNVTLFCLCKIIRERFVNYFSFQFIALIPLLIIGYVTNGLYGSFIDESPMVIDAVSQLLISGFSYLILVTALCWIFPGLLGLKRDQLKGYIGKVLSLIGFMR